MRGSKHCQPDCACLKHTVWQRNPTPNIKHGRRRTKTYRVWSRMKERCIRPGHKSWSDYGGRGIKVCAAWLRFEPFLADMGEVPQGMTLDRIDTDGDYCPENCRWATMKEQARNRRSNHLLTMDGETKTLMEWSEDPRCHVSRDALNKRIRYGWDTRRAITTPHRMTKVTP